MVEEKVAVIPKEVEWKLSDKTKVWLQLVGEQHELIRKVATNCEYKYVMDATRRFTMNAREVIDGLWDDYQKGYITRDEQIRAGVALLDVFGALGKEVERTLKEKCGCR